MNALRFTVPGRVPSNNRTARVFKGRAVKSPDAKLYQARVASHALVAIKAADWVFPDAVRVKITHYNGLIDVDNIAKSTLDGMRGIVFPDDRRRMVCTVTSAAAVDGGEEYIEVVVEPCEPLPRVVTRKCHVCLQSRAGADIKPHVCGICAQRRRRNAA